MNWLDFSFTLFDMVAGFTSKAWDFFTFEISFIGLSLSIFEIIAGFGFTVIITAIIIKALTPFF